MEIIIDFFTPLEAWHWIALALIILGIELAIGTFDLLWISAAAFATAAFKLFMPAPMNGAEGQLFFFAIAAVALLVLGRTAFSGMREKESDKPMLNKRMESMIGSRGLVTQSFSAGKGKVQIGDTQWLAFAENGEDFVEGSTVVIDGVEATAVRVSPA